MKEITKNDINEEQLTLMFESDERTLEFLSSIKWSNGFVCKKCGNTNYCDGKTPYSRRCTRCKNEESATSHTIFHNCKFPVSKAFYIAWNVCAGNQDISSYEYSEKLNIRQMTCWKFKKKIEECKIRQSGDTPEPNPSLYRILMNVNESRFDF